MVLTISNNSAESRGLVATGLRLLVLPWDCPVYGLRHSCSCRLICRDLQQCLHSSGAVTGSPLPPPRHRQPAIKLVRPTQRRRLDVVSQLSDSCWYTIRQLYALTKLLFEFLVVVVVVIPLTARPLSAVRTLNLCESVKREVVTLYISYYYSSRQLSKTL